MRNNKTVVRRLESYNFIDKMKTRSIILSDRDMTNISRNNHAQKRKNRKGKQ